MILKSLSGTALFFFAAFIFSPSPAMAASPLFEGNGSQPGISIPDYEKRKAMEPVHVIGGDLTPEEKKGVEKSLEKLDGFRATFENSKKDVRETVLASVNGFLKIPICGF